jgi:hypothetical protein
MEATAWRFNKYAERAREGAAPATPAAQTREHSDSVSRR